MPANMRAVFFTSLVGFTLLFVWLLNLRIRIAKLEYEQSVHQE
jgi:hypothetical protein